MKTTLQQAKDLFHYDGIVADGYAVVDGKILPDLSVPVVEHVEREADSVELKATMHLAGVIVKVTGQYNAGTDVYYPETVLVFHANNFAGLTYSLFDFCNVMEWDYHETSEAIRQAVEYTR